MMVEAVATQEIESEARDLQTDAKAFQIATAKDYESAGDFLVNGIKKYRQRVADLFDPHIKRAHGVHKELLADKRKHEGPAIEAERIVKDRMLAWKKEEDRKEEEARKAAEAEEKKRAEDAQIAQAEEAAERGDDEAAERIMDEEPRTMPVPKRATTPKVAGVSVRKIWDFELVDAAKIPREYMKVDESKIRQVVRAMKQQAEKAIPGIRVFSRDSMAAGR